MKRRYKKEFIKAYNNTMRANPAALARFTTTASELNKIKLAKKVLNDMPNKTDVPFFNKAWNISVMR